MCACMLVVRRVDGMCVCLNVCMYVRLCVHMNVCNLGFDLLVLLLAACVNILSGNLLLCFSLQVGKARVDIWTIRVDMWT